MKARDQNASDFPAPAVTICSNLFAKNNSAIFFKTFQGFVDKPNLNLLKNECETLTANLHWCQPGFGRMVDVICKEIDILNIDTLKIINQSALTVRKKLENNNFYDFF